MKKVLITGGAGFIGYHLAKKLSNNDYHITIADNNARGVVDKELKELKELSNVDYIQLDVLQKNELNKLDRDYDFIFHMAAIIGVVHVLNHPYEVLTKNISMLENIIDFSREQNSLKRLFFASTSEIYAGTLKHFDLIVPTKEDTPLTVTDLTHPRTSYMLSKIYGEALCQQSGVPFTLFRPHNIYGPRMGMAHVIPEQLRKAYDAKNGDSVAVFSVNHTRCFCYIDDAIEMLCKMMESSKCEGEVLNLGTQNPEISMKEVAKVCFLAAGKKLKIDIKPDSPGSPTRRGPDMSKTINLINFESQVNFVNGVGRTYDWYRKNIFEGKMATAK